MVCEACLLYTSIPLFHVHGEARVPNAVILGHYYYGNLLFCCDEYLTHRAPEQRYPLWPGHEELEALSWLDYFILGDVYSLGSVSYTHLHLCQLRGHLRILLQQ